jgi:glycerol-3-phosphate acyltransferase PlsY
MFTLTTPRAILLGFLAVALAIGSIPFGMKLMDVQARTDITKVAICNIGQTDECARVYGYKLLVTD